MERPSVTFFRFSQKNPLLANKNARKAISLAFDKQGIATTIFKQWFYTCECIRSEKDS